MKFSLKLISLILSGFLCLTIAFGQERTGSIEGTVKDQNGAVIPNATVVVAGNAFSRTVTSNEDGVFRIPQVPPGGYTVSFSAGNFGKVTKTNVEVTLGNASNLEIELKASVGEVVNVTSDDIATIDPTSSKIQANLGAKALEELPKGTNFTTALKAAAPVRTEPTGGGFQIDGASGAENAFILDGQEVTNFRNGLLNTNNNIPFQLIQEVQVKSNGFEAEFGGATGGVISVVTKRGSDSFHGEIGTQIESAKLFGRPRQILSSSTAFLTTDSRRYIQPARDSFANTYPSFFVGGNIIKKRLYFFAGAAPQFLPTTRTFTTPGDGVTRSYQSDTRRDYSFARLDGQVSDKLQLNATYLYNPSKTNGFLPTYTTLASNTTSASAPLVSAQAELGGRTPSTNYSFEGIYTPTQNLSLNVRYGRGYLNEKSVNYGVPQVTQYTCISDGCSAGGAGYRNVPTNSLTLKDISIRKTLDVTAGLYVGNFGGRHSFRFGYQYTGLSNDLDDGNVSLGTIDVNLSGTASDRNGCVRPTRIATPGCPVDATTVLGVGTLSLIGSSGKVKSRNDAVFAQDAWQIGSRLTLNVGIRLEKETVPSFRAGNPGIKFNWNDKLAPRFGAAFDVLGNGKWKVFGSYGRFFDRFKYELPRGSFGGEVQDIYDFIVINPNIFSYTRASILANNINFQDQRTPANLSSDNRIDPNIKPFQQAELTFGTAYDFGKGFILESRYTRKNIIRAIDDIGYHNNISLANRDNEEYFIGNPGEGVCARPACGRYSIPGAVAAKAVRIYNAVETRVQKRFGKLSLDSSYTWSRLFGNYAGSASSDEAQRNGGVGRASPAVSRYFDLPFLGYTLDGKRDDGLLPTDRTHFVKVSGNYSFNWLGSKSSTTNLGVFYIIGSGTPVTTRARYAAVSGQIVSGRGNLGRTATLSQTDFSLSQRYKFGSDNRYAVAFDFNVLNLLNQRTELSRRETITRSNYPPSSVTGCTVVGFDPNNSPLRCLDRAVFNGGITSAAILAFANSNPTNAVSPPNRDERYNLPQLYQTERAVRFGFRFLF
jgi:Carboxypeptidase regulatory-like domain/TonB dependent receptor/TonB-dependent Receptor Plug Domain